MNLNWDKKVTIAIDGLFIDKGQTVIISIYKREGIPLDPFHGQILDALCKPSILY